MEIQNQNCKENQKNCWQASDKEKLTKVLAIIINGQKTYGKDYSIIDTFAYFQFKLESKYSVEQVIYALDSYTDTKNDIPNPADIISILSPVKPRIRESEYIQACKTQERNGFPMYSYESVLIKEYKEQTSQDQEDFYIEDEKVKKLAIDSIKRIG